MTALLAFGLGFASPDRIAAQASAGPHQAVQPQPSGMTQMVGAAAPNAPAGESVWESEFDPADPRVGVGLLASYGAGPLLALETIEPSFAVRKWFIATQLAAGTVGALMSSVAFVDSLYYEGGTQLSIGALSAANGLAMNLDMVARSAMKIVLGVPESEQIEHMIPMLMPFPTDGGAGVAARWVI